MRIYQILKATNLKTGIHNINKNIKEKPIHQYPWFLVGAYATTISTVYIYFNNRRRHAVISDDINSFEPLHI
jgi:hypothetical protein